MGLAWCGYCLCRDHERCLLKKHPERRCDCPCPKKPTKENDEPTE